MGEEHANQEEQRKNEKCVYLQDMGRETGGGMKAVGPSRANGAASIGQGSLGGSVMVEDGGRR